MVQYMYFHRNLLLCSWLEVCYLLLVVNVAEDKVPFLLLLLRMKVAHSHPANSQSTSCVVVWLVGQSVVISDYLCHNLHPACQTRWPAECEILPSALSHVAAIRLMSLLL